MIVPRAFSRGRMKLNLVEKTLDSHCGRSSVIHKPVGDYSVAEAITSDWTLNDSVCDEFSSPSDISLSSGETVTCTFVNTKVVTPPGDDEEEEDLTPPQSPSGPSSRSGDRIQSSGGGGGQAVLGASTELPELPSSCTALLSTYMRRGKVNDVEEVKELQQFLNDNMNAGLPVTGFFGPLTEAAVKAFQLAHTEQVLTPWGITEPTGYVFKTTQRWINLVHCSTLNIPMPDLSI